MILAIRSQRGAGAELGRYEFHVPGRTPTRSLAALLRPTDRLDVDTLMARVVDLAPLREGATAWNGITAVRRTTTNGEHAYAVEGAPPNERDAALALRDELRRAVERSLDGVRRAAVFTGGGVDSAALLALAVEWAKRDRARSVFAVALDFDAPGDDRPFMRALERHLGCEVLRIPPENAVRKMDVLRSGVDAAPVSFPTFPFELEELDRARANGAERALVGVNGDHLFDGDPRSLSQVLARGEGRRALGSARRLTGFDEPRSRVASWLLRPLVATKQPRFLRHQRALRSLSIPSWAGPQLRAHLALQRERFAAHALLSRTTVADRVSAERTDPTFEPMDWRTHQREVASAVAWQDPFRDERLVSFVLSLPRDWLLHGDVRRGLFREAIRGLVPDSIRMRLSKAFFDPAIARLVEAAGGIDALRDLAGVPRLADLGIVEPRSFAEAFAELAADPVCSSEWATLWPVLAVEGFLKTREEGHG